MLADVLAALDAEIARTARRLDALVAARTELAAVETPVAAPVSSPPAPSPEEPATGSGRPRGKNMEFRCPCGERRPDLYTPTVRYRCRACTARTVRESKARRAGGSAAIKAERAELLRQRAAAKLPANGQVRPIPPRRNEWDHAEVKEPTP